ncbi:MAG: hypothetical protein WD690_10430 [Vicinamibacterales bacterium]
MSRILRIVRFFRAADPMPSWLVALTAAVAMYAAWIVAANPSGLDEALAMLLLWQMVCASTGFARHASAGHFDAALVRWPRMAVAAGHALHSIWLVAALWLLVAAIEAGRTGQVPVAFESGRLAAFVFVSVMSWALALPAGRLVTGSLWLALIVLAVTTRIGTDQYGAMLARSDGSPLQVMHGAALAMMCPFLMIGDHLPPRDAVAAALFSLSLGALTMAGGYIRGRDYPLEAAS